MNAESEAAMWRLANAIAKHLTDEPACGCCLHEQRDSPRVAPH